MAEFSCVGEHMQRQKTKPCGLLCRQLYSLGGLTSLRQLVWLQWLLFRERDFSPEVHTPSDFYYNLGRTHISLLILILLASPNFSPNRCPFGKLPHPELVSTPERRQKLTWTDLFISGEADWSINEISSCQLLLNCNPLHCLVICTHFCNNAFEHMNASRSCAQNLFENPISL